MTQTEAEYGRVLLRMARRQLSDYDARSPGTLFASGEVALSVEEAYVLQITVSALRQQRGEQVAGYKIGCVSRTIRRQLGIEHPVFGHVYSTEIYQSPAVLAGNRFHQPAIEGEFAVTLARDARDANEVAAHPERFVDSMFPVIELHNYSFRAPVPSAGELIANNALHAGVVRSRHCTEMGVPGPVEIRVEINGRVDDRSMVDPLATVPELIARTREVGISPRKGSLLLTGSPLPLYRVGPGDRIRVSCRGMPSVQARFKGT